MPDPATRTDAPNQADLPIGLMLLSEFAAESGAPLLIYPGDWAARRGLNRSAAYRAAAQLASVGWLIQSTHSRGLAYRPGPMCARLARAAVRGALREWELVHQSIAAMGDLIREHAEHADAALAAHERMDPHVAHNHTTNAQGDAA